MKNTTMLLVALTALSLAAPVSAKSPTKTTVGCTIYFPKDRGDVGKKGQILIRHWVKTLNELPQREVLLTGYTLKRHPLEYAMALSERLNHVVKHAMKKEGLKAGIIVNSVSRGHKELNPHVRDFGKARVELDALSCSALKAAHKV